MCMNKMCNGDPFIRSQISCESIWLKEICPKCNSQFSVILKFTRQDFEYDGMIERNGNLNENVPLEMLHIESNPDKWHINKSNINSPYW